MAMELVQVTLEDREILMNLLEKYLYEFSQYEETEVNGLGLYGYEYLDYYFVEKNHWAYFMKVEGKLCGFAMVITLPEVEDRETDFQMAEFFVLHKYRGQGIGFQAFQQVLALHPGRWQLNQHPKNLGPTVFWKKSIDKVTTGKYELVKAYPGTAYEDGTLGDVYFFSYPSS